MNISYNWLRDYLPFDLTPEEVAAALTSIGLETGSVETVQSVRGGLAGLVTGRVLTCTAHPNSDHLHLTTVDVGGDEPLKIVCGAPNVAAGQMVVVAVIGTKLYDGDKEFVIKKSKIRGEESFGMICAEDEIGVGASHDGIIVLPADTPVGLPAAAYYKVETDHVLEVDITPNRVDATSHYGVARDLAAYLQQRGTPVALQRPSTEGFGMDDPSPAIVIESVDSEGCPRYSGLTIRGVTVRESPEWLRRRLTAIGLRPINNVVDVTNYVLHELGQPLHAFDAAKITGGRIQVRTMPAGTPFTTLDGIERTLTADDLMICDAKKPMCIGGVFGGLDSGVTESTTDVFLESACFNPTWIRRTARRFGLSTDASFRFERGLDPNGTIEVLKRAALLIREVAGGRITGEIQDVYPNKVEPYAVDITYRKIDETIGQTIPPETVKSILRSLEIEIAHETPEGLSLRVPVYRIDVRRDVDVIEDILRIYGYNNVAFDDRVQSTLSYRTPTDRSQRLESLIAEQLCGAGFHEIMNNSLTRRANYEGLATMPADACVTLMNPLSADLNVMRQTLLFGGLQTIAHNINHKQRNLRFFEFGNCYTRRAEGASTEADRPLKGFEEEHRLGLWLSGTRTENSWLHADEQTSVYELKAYVENILRRLGVDEKKTVRRTFSNEIYSSGMTIETAAGRTLATFGIVDRRIARQADIDTEVSFAELSWTALMKETRQATTVFSEIPKFPEVRRDLALLVDTAVTFAQIEQTAAETDRKLLRRVVLFDVYEGKNLPAGKKSYAVSFYLQDAERTLTDRRIDDLMAKLRRNLESKLGAQLR
ncbi:phenylalanyl-tRNA synthetase subunit beta [Tannerella sp. oral taxon BU063 isolate Cell 8/11]|uniref:Phenylalanine--tRNA ligase beta subunit n=1 Tax=Tannerella sp. oral taxon BU063 isolate Cell 8/11 TaxID=1411915 RepID=W2D0Y1_9BACT|nr:phenylalanyl-tRNA synthetase subunit beta [Tannerella sp. oral taxon BU063 isolate Cell 8/11]